MGWYTITWLGNDGKPLKREILHRPSKQKIINYLEGRMRMRRVPELAWGMHFRESTDEEVWNEFLEEPYDPGSFAIEIPIPVDERSRNYIKAPVNREPH